MNLTLWTLLQPVEVPAARGPAIRSTAPWIMEKICSLSLSRPSCCRAESSVAGWLICLLSVNRGRSLSWESVTTKNCGTLSVMEELSMTCRCVFRASRKPLPCPGAGKHRHSDIRGTLGRL